MALRVEVRLKILEPNGECPLPVITPDRWLQKLDSLDRDELLNLYRQHGGLLVRKFRWSAEDFRAFADQFCSGFVRNRAQGRKEISKDRRIQTVNLGGHLFPFHPEISREPWRPDVLFFGCKRAPREGGETQLADGTRMVEAMNPATREMLSRRSLLYRHPTSPESCARWLGVDEVTEAVMAERQDAKPFSFEILPSGAYARSFRTPALHYPMFSDKLAFGNHMLFSRFMHNIRNFPLFDDESEMPEALCQEMNDLAYAVAYTHRWQKNDLLMVDNTRFMHGRPAFRVKGDRLIMSQFGYLKNPPIAAAELEWQPWRRTPVWIEEDAS